MRFGKYRAAAALTAAAGAAVITAIAPSASAITGPFSWVSTSTASWCGTWHGQNGCNNVQTATGYTSNFDPANVSLASGTVSLLLNTARTSGGAFNTNNTPNALETYNFPFTIFQKINLPCSTPSGTTLVDNWPSFWMARTTAGAVAGTGEIDVAEGSHGVLKWVYHYTNTDGVTLGSASGTLAVSGDANFPCGSTHTGGDYYYKVHAYTNTSGKPQIDFYAKSILQGGVSQTCVGSPCTTIPVAVDTSNRYLINGYGDGTSSGPAVGNVSGKWKEFSYSAS